MERRDEGNPEKSKRQREVELLVELYNRRPSNEDGFDFQGVLLSDAIERCVNAFGLITPFNPENLKPANYKLTIGNEYAINGEIHSLSNEAGKNEIKIHPFEVAIIKTQEIINMPRFLIGRWNIQVSRAYQGLIWVGGPQVDPGYVGHLFCPIYNLSDQDVSLFKGESIAVIDFVRTTEFHHNSKNYKFPPDLVLFEEYKPQKLVSGLVTRVNNRLDKVETSLRQSLDKLEIEINRIQRRVDEFTSITFTVIAILFASISVSAFGKASPPWQYVSVFLLSGFAIFLAASAWLKTKSEGRLFGRAVQIIVVIGLVMAFIFNLSWIRYQRVQINQLGKDIQELKARPLTPTGGTAGAIEPRAEPPVSVSKQPPPAKH